MTFNPGRSVGRVSIRVVPDTTKFRRDLEQKMRAIERTTSMRVRVNKANVDSRSIKSDIQRQLDGIDMSKLSSNAAITVDRAAINTRKLQESIQRRLASFGDFKANLAAQIADKEKFDRDVRRLVDAAERHQVDIPVAVTTAIANARLAYTARTRFVTLVVRVSQASITKTLATLAALSGARLTWKWIDDLVSKLRNLDRTLPAIVGWTTGITSLIAALAGSVSGLVGIGQGLFTILPAFLVLPGLIINAAGSLTVLFVALKHAREELGALSGDMNELGGIIRTTFWDNARQPILDLVQGLMPQLRNSFRELSQGVGQFTGALAEAFGRSLGGGRLESIFGGIAEGWRILATGADGFAGALTSLSQIASRYTPRLAAWFVRQANTFDNWLNAISNDGRLGSWMEQAIDSMYDLWDATKGVAGVFSGIWKAADQAGSGGLDGFGKMMLDWQRVVNSADFQRGLSAVFRGSYAAMDAFGGAVEAIGRLFADMPRQFERFIGSAGGFLGGLIEEIATALNSTKFAIGLDGFSEGLDAALEGITPAIQPIADTFGNFLGALGDIAANLLPAATGVIADLTPSLDALVAGVESLLPDLATALTDISDDLAPAINDFVEAASPVLVSVIGDLADVLVDLAPVLADLVGGAKDIVGAVSAWIAGNEEVFGTAEETVRSFSAKPQWLDELQDVLGTTGGAASSMYFKDQDYSAVQKFVHDVTGVGQYNTPEAVAKAFEEQIKANVQYAASLVVAEYKQKLSDGGAEAASGFLNAVSTSGVPQEVINAVKAQLGIATLDAPTWLYNPGSQAVAGMGDGMNANVPTVEQIAAGLGPRISSSVPTGALYDSGFQMVSGMSEGMKAARWKVIAAAISAADGAMVKVNQHLGIQSPSRKWAKEVGWWLPAGIAMGIDQNAGIVEKSARAALDFNPLSAFRGEGLGGAAGAGAHIEITQPLLPGETPQEQRDNLVRELQLALGS
ncbi:hypothetical protein ACFUTX_06790 [Microbacterium sp. NPDC057407]|uniref:hypothetical protein n=1 Tax=Microbacterium sp. NPDC057407 TaxID=3346120 RepID=UPI003672F003